MNNYEVSRPSFAKGSAEARRLCQGEFPGNRIMRIFITLVGLLCSGVLVSRADTHYVAHAGQIPLPNYTNWVDASSNIQDAINVAGASETVLVSNGTYNLTNQIELTTAITLQSVNGTNFTFINGNYPAYTNRCVYMSAGTLDGFTISNGFLTNGTPGNAYVGGGGIGIGWKSTYVTVKNCYIYKNFITNWGGGGIGVNQAYDVIISNCAVVGNTCSSDKTGGGIYLDYAYRGLLIDSYISGNTGGYGGGVSAENFDCRITNCTIAGNTAIVSYGGINLQAITEIMANCVISNNSANSYAGGVAISGGSKLINSIIIGNSANESGGGAVSSGGMLSNCQVIANTAKRIGGVRLTGAAGSANVVANCIIARNVCSWTDNAAGLYIESGGLVKNCLIYCNTNNDQFGGGVRLFNNALYTNYPYGLINCTIVDNKASARSGINAIDVTNYIENCIVVSNVTFAGAQANIGNATASNTNNYWHTCTPDVLAPNQGNIINNPRFVDQANRNYRLSASSPCINTGTNGSWTATDVDLDGRMRIRYGTVDMGAYEFIHSGTIFTIH